MGEPRHAAFHLEGVHRGVGLLELGEAGRAVSAVRGRGLAEVAQDMRAQAVGGGRVEDHLLQALLVALAQAGELVCAQVLARGLLDEELLRVHVAGGVEQKALGRRSVASGAPGLLVVVLQAARDVVVDDVVDVRLVDAHAEGVRGDHHAGAVVEEVILVAVALCRREARVVARGRDATRAQKLAELLDGLAA